MPRCNPLRYLAILASSLPLLIVIVGSVGCSAKKDRAESTIQSGDQKPPPFTAEKQPDKPKTLLYAEAAKKLRRAAGAQILVAYAGATRSLPNVTRSRQVALARAKEVQRKAMAPGSDFVQLVKEYSDEPGAVKRRGLAGVFLRHGVHPAYKPLADVIFSLPLGGVSEKIMDTPAGYVITKRVPIEEFAARHIWIKFIGRQGVGNCTRSREDALKLAKEVQAKAAQPGADFEALVKEYSEDGPASKNYGGFMGVFNRRIMSSGPQSPLGDALYALEVGGVSDVVESPYGFHILSRAPALKYQIVASQILVKYKGCKLPIKRITRTKEEARQRAEEALAKASKPGADFEALAREYSDDRSASKGGEMGKVYLSTMPTAFEEAAFGLEVGELSGVVESPFGFHIIVRWE